MLDFILFLDDKVMKFIIGRKLGMSQTFDEEGKVIPVTLIEAGPCEIVQVKTKEKDGYESLQFGFEKKEKKIRYQKKKGLRKRLITVKGHSRRIYNLLQNIRWMAKEQLCHYCSFCRFV